MLYQLYDLHHAAWTPVRLAAEAIQTTLQHPLVPASYTRVGRAMAAAAELIERSTRRYAKPEWGIDSVVIDGRRVGVRQTVVRREPFCNVVRFERDLPAGRQDPKLLVVAPMSGHYATLLRGTVQTLIQDHDVYVTDWIDARQVPLSRGGFDLDDYIAYVMAFLRDLGPNAHVLAVCQPAVPVLAAAALMADMDDPCQPRSMTLMGGPIDTTAAPTAVTKLALEHPLSWFERTVVTAVPVYYPGALRQVYPGFLQLGGFMSMHLDRHVGEHLKLFEHLVRGDGESAEGHRRFYDEYLSVMDLPAEFYLQTIATVFQNHDLPKGRMMWRGRPVRPEAIRKTALLTVEGELDDISAPGQTLAAHRLCRNLPDAMRRNHLQKSVGHYGIFNGRKWREQIYPQVRAFIHEYDDAAAQRLAAE
ncbi:MAG TPA: polyhydroxyalkanoate depolymerase [Alphaproteobacteria bacterium]|nr:polyhydroxyalkanoate depolymerase [Alphaproteobacteria bacterium]